MKKSLCLGLMGCLLGGTAVTATAQNQKELDRGEVLELNAPDGLKNYQWQVSTDLQNFIDLPDAEAQKLSIKVYVPGFYRLKTVTEDYKTVYSDTTEVKIKAIKYSSKISETTAAHGFVETLDGKPGASGISMPEDRDGAVAAMNKTLTNWTNGNAMAVHYLHHPKETIDTDMILRVKANQKVAFRLTVWNPSKMDEPMAETYLAIKGTGKPDTIWATSVTPPMENYYRYQLECLNGWNNIEEITKFRHHSPSPKKTWKSGYMSSPSVHLNNWASTHPQAPKGRAYDWCYMEVMMPKIADIPGTYIMSLGVLDGYMGIQMNGYKNDKPLHDVIFSMWDHGSVDEDPNLPANLRANVVDYGPGVKPERFANEGTGMKTFKSGYNWDCDTFVQFITNCRPEVSTYKVIKDGKEEVIKQNNTLVSTWYNANDGKGWQYMATLRLANKSIFFDSWYSFLENYNYPTGEALRRGYYRNGYGHSKDNKTWYHFNRVNFGHTDGALTSNHTHKIGARYDFGQGTTTDFDQTFFMTTGGFIPSNVTENEVPLNKVNTPVDTINLDKLLLRVDQAVAHEKKQMEAKENFEKNKLDKKGWKVIKFSSQEASGEGSNGKAALIIDGNEKTYWHSQWQGNKAQYPHYFIVDMQKEYNVNGMQITTSNGGGNRHIKSYNLYLSKDNKSWEKVYSETGIPDQDTFQILLDNPVTARYFKLEITEGYATEGPFVRVNEIEVTAAPETGIEEVNGSNTLEVNAGKGELLVKVPAALANAEISVFRADGACVSSNTYSALAEGEIVRIPMNAVVKGVYVVSCKAGNYNVSKQILWNK